MYGDGIDVDSPVPSQRKKRDPFQKELQRKLKDRKSRGLSADITSPEEESEEDDFLSQFISPKKREDRPRSAKHRAQPSFLKSQRDSDWKPGLGDTLRPGAAGDILGRGFKTGYLDNSDDEDDDSGDMTLNLGSSKSSQNPKSGDMLTKTDIIFGRKSPSESKTPERSKDKLPWQPPSFKKTQLPETDNNRAPSPGSSKGRKTPTMDPLLESINETPTPRSRILSQTSDESKSVDPYSRPKPKPRGKKEDIENRDGKRVEAGGRRTPTMGERKTPSDTGRKTPTDYGRKTPTDYGRKTPTDTGRKTPTDTGRRTIDTGRRTPSGSDRKSPTSDIFGKSGKSSTFDFLESEETEEEKKAPKVTPRRLSGKPDVNSRSKSPGPSSGRKTPVSGKDASGKKLKRATDPPNEEKRKEEEINNRRASVMDFLMEDSAQTKKKSQKSVLSRSDSADSITDELEHSVGDQRRSRPQSRGTPKLKRDPSNSSICEDIQTEPLSTKHQEGEFSTDHTQRSSGPQRSDKKQAEDAINSVAGAQDKGMQFIEPDKENKKKKKTGPKFGPDRPKPRYPSKPGEIIDMESPSTFEDTTSIRNAIFVEWYKERNMKAKEALKEKKKLEAAEEEKKRKEKDDKVLENKASYNAWLERKKSGSKEKTEEKMEEERKKKQEQDEKNKKKKDAEKTFNTWKERKDSIIKTVHHKVKDEEKSKEREETEKKREKEKLNSKAYKSWKERKDTIIVSTIKKEKNKMKEETDQEKRARLQKEREAVRQYEDWMKKKEEQEKLEKERRRRKKLEEDDEFRPAWSPANRTIPFGR